MLDNIQLSNSMKTTITVDHHFATGVVLEIEDNVLTWFFDDEKQDPSTMGNNEYVDYISRIWSFVGCATFDGDIYSSRKTNQLSNTIVVNGVTASDRCQKLTEDPDDDINTIDTYCMLRYINRINKTKLDRPIYLVAVNSEIPKGYTMTFCETFGDVFRTLGITTTNIFYEYPDSVWLRMWLSGSDELFIDDNDHHNNDNIYVQYEYAR